jgi:hypothetical protein
MPYFILVTYPAVFTGEQISGYHRAGIEWEEEVKLVWLEKCNASNSCDFELFST